MEKEKSNKYITLVLTHQCNLRCTYCYEKHKDNNVMTFETAKSILSYEMILNDGTENVEIDLFGGEPLLEFDLIKDIVEWSKTQVWSKNFIFFIVTNGVLLTREIKEWLKENTRYIQAGLSLDGTKKMHDINRCNSFDKIDINFFREFYPEQPVKMTISQESLPMLAEGVIFCHKLGFEIACNLAYGIDWSAKQNEKILGEQLMLLIQYYLDNPGLKPCSLLDVYRLVNVSQSDSLNYRVCGAGWTTKAYDYDGINYACQHFLPLSVGEKKAKESLNIKFHGKVIADSMMNEDCLKCCLRNSCMTCYGANYAATGNIFEHDKNMCQLSKIQFKAMAYFAAKMYEKNMLDLSDPKVASIIKAALIINNEINC